MVRGQVEIVWVVVLVESGIPVFVEAFRDEQSAVMSEQTIRARVRPDYDDTGIFEIPIQEAISTD